MSNMYLNKYLKYKNKYMELKNQLGGEKYKIADIVIVIDPDIVGKKYIIGEIISSTGDDMYNIQEIDNGILLENVSIERIHPGYPSTKANMSSDAMNPTLDSNGWKRYEKSISEQNKKVLEMLRNYVSKMMVRNVESGEYKDEVSMQEYYPISYGKRYNDLRKERNFSKLLGLEVYVEGFESSESSEGSEEKKSSVEKKSREEIIDYERERYVEQYGNAELKGNMWFINVNGKNKNIVLGKLVKDKGEKKLVKPVKPSARLIKENASNEKFIELLEPLSRYDGTIIPRLSEKNKNFELFVCELLIHIKFLIECQKELVKSEKIIKQLEEYIVKHGEGRMKDLDIEKKRGYDLKLKLYEGYFGIGKFISELELGQIRTQDHTSGEINKVDPLIISDLKRGYEKICSTGIFDIKEAAELYPKLFYSTKYDDMLPGIGLKPYESQIDMLKIVRENLGRGFSVVLNALMAMGKTTLVTAIAQLIKKINTDRIYENQYTLIYCCPHILEPVRETVGQNSSYLDLNWSYAGIDRDDRLIETIHNKKSKSGSPGNPGNPDIIIAGIRATYKLLIDAKNKNRKYVLFYDEPTIKLDNIPSDMTKYLYQVFRFLPSCSIFSSATFPDMERIPKLKDYITSKYGGDIKFETVSGSNVSIGTEVNDLDGNMWIPHSKCRTSMELLNITEKIRSKQMTQKCYTLGLVEKMYDKMVNDIKITVPEEINFLTYMDRIGNRNQNAIQKLALSYLKLVGDQCDDNIVIDFCRLTVSNKKIDIDNMASNKMDGQTFISSQNPVDTLKKMFDKYYLSGVKDKSHIDSFNMLSAIYKADKDELDKKIVLLTKTRDSKRKPDKSDKSDKSDKLDKMQIVREIDQSIENLKEIFSKKYGSILEPKLGSIDTVMGIEPNYGSILEPKLGSIDTVMGIEPNYGSILEPKLGSIDTVMGIERLEQQSTGTYDIEFATLCGIGVYDPENQNSRYTDYVIDMTSERRLAYLCASPALNYGNSFPFDNGIILEDMSVYSYNTIYQLMGRAGRPGVSDRARIYAHDQVIAKLDESLYGDSVDIELENLNLVIDLVNDKVKKAKEKKAKEEEAEREAVRAAEEVARVTRVAEEAEAEEVARVARAAEEAAIVARVASVTVPVQVPVQVPVEERRYIRPRRPNK